MEMALCYLDEFPRTKRIQRLLEEALKETASDPPASLDLIPYIRDKSVKSTRKTRKT